MTTSSTAGLGQRNREELRGFLRSRRARLTPSDVGLPDTGRRRTPGLRREEVAFLAGVGVSWYTWLEQGRDITVSDGVVGAISGALRLSGAERAHLYLLAGHNPPPADPAASPAPVALQRLLDAWMPNPGYVRDRHWNMLARNTAADAVFDYDDHDNCLLAFFTSPTYRSRHREWEAAAPSLVAELRSRRARYRDDPAFDELVDALLTASDEFAVLWWRHDVDRRSEGAKPIEHPEVGLLVLDHTVLTLPDHPDLTVVLYTPQPGTGTEQRLARLT